MYAGSKLNRDTVSKTLYPRLSAGSAQKTPRHAVSGLGQHCLHVSHKNDAMLIWIKCQPAV